MPSKPIVRWTIGQVNDEGFSCLRHSVNRMRLLYGYSFTYAICHNSLLPLQKLKLPDVDMLVDQKQHVHSLAYGPGSKCAASWKIYPARLDDSVHEIILDNDLVIYDRLPAIDEFLARDDLVLVTEAFKRSYSGVLEASIPSDFNINCGFICIPPKFDYGAKLSSIMPGEWSDYFDDQTLIAAVLSRCEFVDVVKVEDIFVCAKEYKRGNFGVHFVGLNIGLRKFWNEYISEFKGKF